MRRALLPLAFGLILPSLAETQGVVSVQGFGYPPGQLSAGSLGIGGANAESDPASALNPAGIGMAGQLFALVLNVLGLGVAALGEQPGLEGLAPMMHGALGMIGAVLGLAAGAFIIYGALQMQRLVNYPMALAASVVAMVPCLSPCCCLGLPVGIWALVVLMKPEVKAAFR